MRRKTQRRTAKERGIMETERGEGIKRGETAEQTKKREEKGERHITGYSRWKMLESSKWTRGRKEGTGERGRKGGKREIEREERKGGIEGVGRAQGRRRDGQTREGGGEGGRGVSNE